MSDELRAAAERLQSHVDECDLANGFWLSGTDIDTVMALTRAYLAEHPADDAEPVTEEWLRGAGFVEESHSINYIGIFRDKTCIYVYMPISTEQEWVIDRESCPHGLMPSTRGDVRRLCAALGIELKEKK